MFISNKLLDSWKCEKDKVATRVATSAALIALALDYSRMCFHARQRSHLFAFVLIRQTSVNMREEMFSYVSVCFYLFSTGRVTLPRHRHTVRPTHRPKPKRGPVCKQTQTNANVDTHENT
jgi:hypothetical protein